MITTRLKIHSTPNETIAYMKEFYFPKASDAQLNTLAALYPSDPAAGSPFNTGDNNTLTPQFKRLNGVSISIFQRCTDCKIVFFLAFQGDVFFQAPRRNMFNVTAGVVPHWSFCEIICLLTNLPFIDGL
jgi:acetylcholinesterase